MDTKFNSKHAAATASRIADRAIQVGIVGLGYVGLPLALGFADGGIPVVGFDIDSAKVESIAGGRSYIKTIPSESVAACVSAGRFRATTDFREIASVDVVIICVPTPLNKHREPDLSFVERTAREIAPHLRPGQVLSLESTTYPGTTDEIVRPIVEAQGLRCGVELFLVYSPEREDPGNKDFGTTTTPKVVGGENADALALGIRLYELVTNRVVPVSSLATAEAVKLTENIFRAVNIALVNELKVTFDRMGIDIWEVVDAAKTKPFGYMPFYPGPGLGGHCIPIDPFYLTWKAREFGISTRFIELAGEVNSAMPDYVITRLREALDVRMGKGLSRARLLLVGLAYKRNVDDTRESPSLVIMERLLAAGAHVEYLDSFVPVIPMTREHPSLAGRTAVGSDSVTAGKYDAALICTDHEGVNYEQLLAAIPLVVDTRNATKAVAVHRDRIVRA